jgi:hypothetical protein
MNKRRESILTLSLLWFLSGSAYGSIEADLGGFDEVTPQSKEPRSAIDEEMLGFEEENSFDEDRSKQQTKQHGLLLEGLSGKFSQQITYSWQNDAPYDRINSFKSSLLLDYEHKFESGVRIKVNAKAYYDAIYVLKGRSDYTQQTLDALESEIELFDAYVEGKWLENLDYKIGRQVVVWGRSDTIRVTDVLNPLDNRNPAMTDIEDLRLPVAMVKLDYFIDQWRISPMVILEQRFSKNPPFGSDFGIMPLPKEEDYEKITYAMSISGEFEGWDISFYGAKLYDDEGVVESVNDLATLTHEPVVMGGLALNILWGSWLFKGEFAYFDGVKYSSTQSKEFVRMDGLLGFEYSGIADTTISYDVVSRHIDRYDRRLLEEINPLGEQTYQHAFRVTSSFLNDQLNANYLLSLYGEKGDEGGFQRAWVKVEVAEATNMNLGIIDYIGGSPLFDEIEDNDKLFIEFTYSF